MDKETQFKDLIKLKYNDKYNLDNIWYRTPEYLIHIECPIHGSFSISPTMMLNNRACPICKDKPIKVTIPKQIKCVFNYADYLKSNEAYLYCVQLTNNKTQESFFKIGVTCIEIDKRFSSTTFNINPIIMYKADKEVAYELEQEFHSMFREYRYIPNYMVNGHTECYPITSTIPKTLYKLLYV